MRRSEAKPSPAAVEAAAMRRLALILVSIVAAGATVSAVAGAQEDVHTYKIEIYNAFGLVPGSDVRVSGVNVGSITDLDVNEE
jgi:ABC-type transporter Mla subunit MlaD